ncbi:hypothetical protein ASZ90_010179 [hydrocarbon metagenome]|uniref:Uncharacterized protein n=1 Tax=hydrocarbon metagenome TaxID=938273 RepID=A0A0W8FGR0_9ZZZZ
MQGRVSRTFIWPQQAAGATGIDKPTVQAYPIRHFRPPGTTDRERIAYHGPPERETGTMTRIREAPARFTDFHMQIRLKPAIKPVIDFYWLRPWPETASDPISCETA